MKLDDMQMDYLMHRFTYAEVEWESIRVYPSLRKAVRYYNGEKEEYYY